MQQVLEGINNVFDPSVCPSVSQSISPVLFFIILTPLKLLNRILWNFVAMKDFLHRCADLQEILIHFFSWSLAPFERRNLIKIKYTTEF